METLSDRIEKLHKAAEAILKAADAIKDGIKPAFEHAAEEIKALQESMKKGAMNDEGKAHLLGFRNANCMYRAVRRRKRWEEKERRRRLKEGNKDARS